MAISTLACMLSAHTAASEGPRSVLHVDISSDHINFGVNSSFEFYALEPFNCPDVNFTIDFQPERMGCLEVIIYDYSNRHRLRIPLNNHAQYTGIIRDDRVVAFATVNALTCAPALVGTLKARLSVVDESGGCSFGTKFANLTFDLQPLPRRRDVDTPRWISLNEFAGESYVWLKHTVSAYGVKAAALMGGAKIFEGREFLKLASFESANYILMVPGLFLAGPYNRQFQTGEVMEGHGLLRYSARDAAWLLWDYKETRPFELRNLANDDVVWQQRLPAVAADIPSLMFEVRPLA